MANELRNEVEVELAGKKLLLRPTFGCLLEIESRTGKSIMQLVREIEGATLSIKDTVIIYEEATKAAERPLTSEEVIDLIQQVGIVDIQTATVDFFTKALFAGPNAKTNDKKKVKAKN